MARPSLAIVCGFGGLLLMLASGCRQPLQVMAGVRLIPELAGPGNADGVQPQGVPNADGDGNGPAIAVIDVDGLLLNTDFTGLGSAGENPVAAVSRGEAGRGGLQSVHPRGRRADQ